MKRTTVEDVRFSIRPSFSTPPNIFHTNILCSFKNNPYLCLMLLKVTNEMRRLIAFLFILNFISVLSVFGQQVSEESAFEKAMLFLTHDNNGNSILGKRALLKKPQLRLANKQSEYYIFNDEENGGYVVVSGEERMPDILGYSHQGIYSDSDVPCNMQAWLDGYAEQVAFLHAHPEAKVRTSASVQRKRIEPMLKCRWNQRVPFYNLCPIGSTGLHCVTGCVATAMAQILFYYQWPQQTTDTIPTYEFGLENGIPEIEPTKIDWDNILPYYGKGYTEPQANAVASLMRLCGAAVQAYYSETQTGADSHLCCEAFYKYFNYSRSLLLNSKSYSLDVWSQMMYDELANEHPVYYSIGGEKEIGHAVVLEGYDKDGYFYFNWGGGSQSVCYLLTEIDGYKEPGNNAIVNLRCLKPDETDFRGVIPNIYGIIKKDTVTVYGKDEFGDGECYYTYDKLPEGFCDLHYNQDMLYCILDSSIKNCRPKYLGSLFSGNSNLILITGLEHLNTSNSTNMAQIFYGCNSIKELDLSNFETSNVENMASMFYGCKSIRELDLSSFETSNVENMAQMFYGCKSLETIYAGAGWNTENVKDGTGIFMDCNSLKGGMGTSHSSFMDSPSRWHKYACIDGGPERPGLLSEKDGKKIFGDLSQNRLKLYFDNDKESYSNVVLSSTSLGSLAKICIDNEVAECVFDPSFLQRPATSTELSNLFSNCKKLREIKGLENLSTNYCTNMQYMFSGCSSLTSLDLSHFNTENVTSMENMFFRCSSLTNLDLSHFNTENVTNMEGMFSGCSSLTSLDLSHFNTENVTRMGSMFSGCYRLTNLDLASFNTEKVVITSRMFQMDSELTTIYVGNEWSNEHIEWSDGMFSGCQNLIGGKGTKFNPLYIDKTYGCIDGGTDNPGYFTYKESTGINNLNNDKIYGTSIYKLSGAKTNQFGNGINIINGKKYMITK